MLPPRAPSLSLELAAERSSVCLDLNQWPWKLGGATEDSISAKIIMHIGPFLNVLKMESTGFETAPFSVSPIAQGLCCVVVKHDTLKKLKYYLHFTKIQEHDY